MTLDLNGFAILGPTDCSGGLDPCAGAGTGNGIVVPVSGVFNITIRNGTIQGMGRRGIELGGGASHLVEYVHVRSNGDAGIVISGSEGSIVQYNRVQRNGRGGIFLDIGMVHRNVVDKNGSSGIRVFEGSVSYNIVARNVLNGLDLSNNTGYFGNAITGPSACVFGFGLNQGQNMCNGSAISGAQF